MGSERLGQHEARLFQWLRHLRRPSRGPRCVPRGRGAGTPRGPGSPVTQDTGEAHVLPGSVSGSRKARLHKGSSRSAGNQVYSARTLPRALGQRPPVSGRLRPPGWGRKDQIRPWKLICRAGWCMENERRVTSATQRRDRGLGRPVRGPGHCCGPRPRQSARGATEGIRQHVQSKRQRVTTSGKEWQSREMDFYSLVVSGRRQRGAPVPRPPCLSGPSTRTPAPSSGNDAGGARRLGPAFPAVRPPVRTPAGPPASPPSGRRAFSGRAAPEAWPDISDKLFFT